MLDDQLTLDQCRFVDQRIDADEFGPALVTLADWLAEAGAQIPDDIRRDFERLSAQIGNADQVMGALNQLSG